MFAAHHRPPARTSRRRFVWFLTLGLWGATCLETAGYAQSAEVLLASVQERYRAQRFQRDVVGVGTVERELRRLEELAGAAPATRDLACDFLLAVVRTKGGRDEVLRWRTTAVRLIGLLAESPSYAEKLVQIGLQGGPSARGLDLFVERALGLLRGEGHVRDLVERLADSNPRMLRLALGGLARQAHPALRDLLASHTDRLVALSAHVDLELAWRAIEVLGRGGQDSTVATILQASRKKERLLRLGAARALGFKGHLPGVTGVLADLACDEIPLVREEAIRSLGRAAHRSATGFLIKRLKKEPLRLRYALGETLRELTGQNLGPDPDPWDSWFQSHGSSTPFLPTKPPRPYAPTYYGIPVRSDRVLFVLDISMSMGYALQDNTKSESRLHRAKRELVKVLEELDERTQFNVLLFSSGVIPWKTRGLASATPEGIRSAVTFVKRQGHVGKTNPYAALHLAFSQFETVDTIYFLSDGYPTVGVTTAQDRILELVHEWNRLRGVRIHTVALVPSNEAAPEDAYQPRDDALRFLRLLAEETGGTFTWPTS